MHEAQTTNLLLFPFTYIYMLDNCHYYYYYNNVNIAAATAAARNVDIRSSRGMLAGRRLSIRCYYHGAKKKLLNQGAKQPKKRQSKADA